MTLLDILGVVVPPSAAFAYHSYTRLRARQSSEDAAFQRAQLVHKVERERRLSDEEHTELRDIAAQQAEQRARIAALELQVIQHQQTLNRLQE
jgi:hypothetical protein